MNIEATRQAEFHQVCSWFDTQAEEGKVDIYGISGYGGIGKSFLLRHVLEHKQLVNSGYLTISLDASDPSKLGDLIGIYDHSLAPRSIPHGKDNFDYFPRARKLSNEHRKLSRSVENAIKKAKCSDEIKKAAKLIFRGGSLLNKTVPKTKEYIDFESLKKLEVDKHFEDAVDILSELKPLTSSSWIPGLVKDLVGITYTERLKFDLYRLAADEWVADLCAILNKYRRADIYKFSHSPIKGLKRLLLIVDDFEILGKTIIEFITTALIPALQRSNFHTTLIFVGRDDLSDAHVSFQHHLSSLIQKKIRIDTFKQNVTRSIFLEAGYGEEDLDKLMEESRGYPFLVYLLCEAKGGSVSFYQQFYERTTRWIGPTEKEWVLPLCYLERITEGSVSAMISTDSPSLVMDWFKHEASLRDPHAEYYVVAPYIRRTLIEFHRKEIGSQKSDCLIKKGKNASCNA